MPSPPTLLAAVLWSLVLAMPATSSAEPLPSDLPPDPFLWLEDVSGTEPLTWVHGLNLLCTIGFAVATAFWLYRLVTARLQPSADGSDQTIGILCQLAMAAGMGIMFSVML